jgi:GTPase SAR1 family protein
MTSTETDQKFRKKYRHFRILVIGRANAGKTTLLKRVCNTTEEPCIYDEDGESLVRFPSNLQVVR